MRNPVDEIEKPLTEDVGVLLGSLVTLSLRDRQRLPVSPVPSLVTAMTTIVVGWWIHTAVRRRGELDRIRSITYRISIGESAT